jgi:hypothetical protein
VNETPGKPAITWDSQGLKIDATNSSLRQILNDVSTATGAKVEGFGTDERVFGEYGPGQARDVISQLLHGSGYNVLLIGDQGAGTPRQIVLSTRKAASTQGQAQQAFNRPIQDAPDEWPPATRGPATTRPSRRSAHAAAGAAGTAAAPAADAGSTAANAGSTAAATLSTFPLFDCG